MTTPALTERQEFTMDELEQATAEPQKSALPLDAKLDGDDVPDAVRGKTVKELIDQSDRLSQALRLSETERIALRNQTPAATPAAPAPAPADDYKFASREEIKELWDQDPLAATERMQNDALVRAERHFAQRFGSIENSVYNVQEAEARKRYADEFTVLGKEISALVDQVPDKRVLADPRSWDDLIGYVRGTNFDKMMEYRLTKKVPPDAKSAREEQQANIGFSPRPTGREEAPVSTAQLDRTTLEIAEGLGMTPEDYVKWSRVGG